MYIHQWDSYPFVCHFFKHLFLGNWELMVCVVFCNIQYFFNNIRDPLYFYLNVFVYCANRYLTLILEFVECLNLIKLTATYIEKNHDKSMITMDRDKRYLCLSECLLKRISLSLKSFFLSIMSFALNICILVFKSWNKSKCL